MCIEYYKYYLITLNCLSRLSKGEEERERDNAQKSSCEWMIDDHMYIIVEQRECQQRHTIQNRTGNFNSNEIVCGFYGLEGRTVCVNPNLNGSSNA